MDNPSTTQVNGSPTENQSAGMRLPLFAKGKSRPNPFSARDMNRIISKIDAMANLQVRISDASENGDGTYTQTGKFTISNINAFLDLFLAPADSGSGTANIVPMQVVSYTTTNEYLSAKMGSFTAADTFTATGSAINVALPWELRPAQKPSGSSIWPAYAANDIIWVLSTEAGQNGVYVSGSELLYMDLGLGRCWSRASGINNYQLVPCNLPSSGNPTFSDYFVVKDGSGNLFPVAKPPELRCSISQEYRETVQYTYAYNGTAGLLYQRRTASGNSISLIEGISPPYVPYSASPLQPGSNIYTCIPDSGTGVVVAAGDSTSYFGGLAPGGAVTLLDLNLDGRAWSVLPDQDGEGS